ncbi:MAG: glycosyltransferase, partial [Thermoleophilaceae bacterium]
GGAADRIEIVGDGPLRGELEAAIAERGVGDLVTLTGPLQPAEVLARIERSDVLCMPCVVAADGDRDSMPVVVKEALALEVPVVGTDEVGLPEVVRPEWGVLVPPRDPAALADALRGLLDRPAAERAAMGRAGRAFVAECCELDGETAKLAALIARAAGVGAPQAP